MRLSARAIINYNNINSFAYSQSWIVRNGESNTLYFQLIDLDQASVTAIPGAAIVGYYAAPILAPVQNPGLRHLTGVGTGNTPVQVRVIFPSIDDAKRIDLIAVQADPNDSSIFGVSIPTTVTPNSGAVHFIVAEGNNVRRFSVDGMIQVEFPTNSGCDGIIPNKPFFGPNGGF